MKTVAEVMAWQRGARALFGDPATPVTQVFARYVVDAKHYDGPDCVFSREPGQFAELTALRIFTGSPREAVIFIPVVQNGPRFASASQSALEAFGVESIATGLWTLKPSLNIPNVIHAFITLYDVPDPAPWPQVTIF